MTPTIRKQILALVRQIEAATDPGEKRELRKELVALVARNPR